MTSKSIFKRVKTIAICAAVASSALVFPSGSASATADVNFAKALQYSIYFYDANMCGTGVSENNRYKWRGDCHTYDAKVPLQPMDASSVGTNLSQTFIDKYKDVLDPDGDGCVDVSGGFHDAGDHVKFGMPENYSAATLGWGYYEFRDSYVKTGQDDHIETILRYFNDYLMKCTFRDKSGNVVAHCYQVGDGDIDHKYWEAPEIDEMARPAFFLTGDKPQTDYVASAAASLAINYLNFKDTDPDYAAKSLDYAKALFSFAQSHEKQLSDNGDGPKAYYNSSKWQDDYCWAAAWLFKITGDHSYLEEIYPNYDFYAAPCYVYCWNDMWGGVQCLLGEISAKTPAKPGEHTYPNFIDEFKVAAKKSPYEEMNCWDSVAKAMGAYMTGGVGTITPAGYFWLNTWGSARYNTAAQLIGLVYDKYNGTKKFSDWAEGQMKYLMGDNPIDRCYIVGYSANSAKFPHHRAASGLSKCEDTADQLHVLYGALVGGPDAKDQHNDITKDWIYNEVTIDYNAAFVGACAGLYNSYATSDMTVTPDFPPVEKSNGKTGGNNFWVNAYAADDFQTTGSGVTKIASLMMTDSISPKTDLSMRYFFSIKEMSNKANISLVKATELYDQSSVEAAPADGVISGPFQYNAAYDPDIYYVEVKWDGYKIANANKKYQFSLGFYYGDKWDPTNDWSYQGITKCPDTYSDGSETKTDHICVYSNGVLVGGIEPDGTTVTEPATDPTTTTNITTTKAAVTTTKTVTTTAASSNVYGDANADGKVDISDVVLIRRYLINSKKYPITAKGLVNCDVHSQGNGINAQDAVAVQQFVFGTVKALPVS